MDEILKPKTDYRSLFTSPKAVVVQPNIPVDRERYKGLFTPPPPSSAVPMGGYKAAGMDEETQLAAREVLPETASPEKQKSMSRSPAQLRADPEAMADIREYMKRRYGTGGSVLRGELYAYDDEQDDDEVFDMFLTKMRRFNAGQSVVALNELAFVNNAQDEDLVAAQRAYDRFDELGGLFSENYSWGETFTGVGSYMRAAIIDPTNIVGLGVGGVAAKAGGKGTTQLVKTMAKEAAEGAVKRAVAKRKMSQESKDILFEQTYRKAVEKAFAKTSVQTAAKKDAYRGVVAGGVADTAVTMGPIAAYEQTQVEVGRQEEHEALSYALGLGAGLVSSGIGAAIVKMSDIDKPALLAGKYLRQSTPEADARATAKTLDPKSVVLDLDFDLKALVDNPPPYFSWSAKKSRGTDVMNENDLLVRDPELAFVNYMLFGDEETGAKGLVRAMADAGLRRVGTRHAEDNVTNYLLDTMRHIPAEYKDKLTESFRNTYGKAVPQYENITYDEFLDLSARKVSDAGRLLGMMGRTSRILREKPTTAQLLEADPTLVPDRTLMKQALGVNGYLQNNVIRAIVTHPGTVALNLTGGASYSIGEIGKDIIKATLYGGTAAIKTVIGKSGTDPWNTSKAILASQRDKFRNLLNPLATYDEFQSYLAVRQGPREAFNKFLSGGDDKVTAEEAIKRFGFDPKENVLARGMDNTLDFFQTVYGAKLVDNFMKSQSFMFHLGQRIRIQYGQDYDKFLQRDDLFDVMNSNDFMKLEAEAVEETLRSTFSKSYSQPNKRVAELMGEQQILTTLATGVEEFRRIPVFGLAIPFGRFFNNTVALMADVSGASVIHKMVAGNDTRSYGELIARAGTGVAAVGLMMDQEIANIDQGLAWYEQRDAEGAIQDLRYDYPLSFIKYVARVAAHVKRDGAIPEDYMPHKEFARTFGVATLTRDFTAPEQTLVNMFEDISVNGPTSAVLKALAGPVETYATGFTRFLEPLNQVAALVRGEDYEVVDRKQGNEVLNNSMRYVDNIFAATISAIKGEDTDIAPAKRTITRVGDLGQNPTASISVRENAPVTYAQRVLNVVGVPHWTMDAKSRDAEANSRVNEMASYFAEMYAKRLWENPEFHKKNIKDKKIAATQVFENARETSLKTLEKSVNKDDQKAVAIFRLRKNYRDRDIMDAMEALQVGDKELTDLSVTQLELIKEWITGGRKAAESLVE